MRNPIVARFSLALLTSLVVLCLSPSAFGAATIVIQNSDAPNVGFNDPTPVAPTGLNPGTTLGQQRLNAFQYAANIWGAILNSSPTITVKASWVPMTCTTNSAALGSAGTPTIWSDFSGATFPNTWYSAALANSLTGVDLQTTGIDPQEINARFNVNLGNPGCLDGIHFYLGLDNKHGQDVDLVTVLLHEFTHGFGFQTFTNPSNGVRPQQMDSIYDRFLFDDTAGKTWIQMTDAERQASAINTNNLTWNGPRVTTDLQSILATPRLKVNSPGAIAGNYVVGTASFGAPLSSPGVTANVALAAPADGCSSLTNGAAISGRIALIDRGTCTFVTKVKNAQNAGAVGVIIANNVPPDSNNPSGVITMSGSDTTITIPSVMVTQVDGGNIKSQVGSGVNATLLLDPSAPAGTDASGRALMFAPATFSQGSSVSHWDTSEYPNQLMEPNESNDLTHSVAPTLDLTTSILRDIGWSANPIGDTHFFVRQHYLDFFNRAPDSSGLGFWTNEISSCGLDPVCNEVKHINVSGAFFLSIEFQQTGYLVHRFYRAAYGEGIGNSTFNGAHTLPVPIVRRQEFVPDTQSIGQGVVVGVGNWQQVLEANKQAFALAFVQRPAFTAKYPTTDTPAFFVDSLFATAGVSPSATDRQAAINEFGGAPNTTDVAARGRAMRDVAENSILDQQEKNKAFVLMQYFGYLRRNPNDTPDTDYTGYDFWLTKLNQFNGNFVSAEMVKAFLNATEYRQRFGP
jgi:hypothetical protein